MNKQFILTIGLVLALLGPLNAAPVAAAHTEYWITPGLARERYSLPKLGYQQRCPKYWGFRHHLRLVELTLAGNLVGGSDSLSNVLVSNGIFDFRLNDQAQLRANAFDGSPRYWRPACNSRREPFRRLLETLI